MTLLSRPSSCLLLCCFVLTPIHSACANSAANKPPSTNGSNDLLNPDPQAIAILSQQQKMQHDGFEELYLTASVNKQPSSEILSFLTKNSALYIPQSLLLKQQIILPTIAPVAYEDTNYYPITVFKNTHYTIDKQNLTISLDFPVDVFKPTIINKQAKLNHYRKPDLGAYFNYNIYAYSLSGQNQLNSNIEVGLFNQYGMGTSSFLVNTGSANDTQNIIRLFTTWTYDNPDKMQTWHFGDAITQAGSWGNAVNFAGVQWSTNFNTQPNFTTYPLMTLQGVSVLPSVSDLYINSMAQGQAKLQPGPFYFNNVPLVDGQGNIKLITTDILGRQQIVNLPFYNSRDLLKQGLEEFSYEVGLVRMDFGLESNNYRDLMFTGTQRKGITDKFTRDIHTELLAKQQTAGIGGSYLINNYGVLNSAVAISNANDLGQGGMWLVGFERRTDHYSYTLQGQLASPHFTKLGYDFNQPAPRASYQASVGFPLGQGNLGLAYLNQQNQIFPNTQLLSATYSRAFGHNLFMLLSLAKQKTQGQTDNNTVLLNLTIPFGNNANLNAGVGLQNSDLTESLQLSRSLSQGSSYGYDIAVENGLTKRQQASISMQNNYTTFIGSLNNNDGITSGSINLMGGVVLLDKHFYLTRRIDNSFAVVKIPSFVKVDVYANSTQIGQTNAKGEIFVGNLIPYMDNTVSLGLSNLPYNIATDTIKQNVTLYPKTGIVVQFDIKQTRAATLTIKQASGEVIPLGASVKINEQTNSYIVGEDGLTYLADLQDVNLITVNWFDKQCSFRLHGPTSQQAARLANLGTFICTEDHHAASSP
jgi:outer membrane usher protein